MEALGIFLMSTLGSIVLTVLFQDTMGELVAIILPESWLVGNKRKFSGNWEVSYTKHDGDIKLFRIKLKQINGRVWGTSEIEPTLSVTYKLYGRLKGDKLSGVWFDTNSASVFHGVYFVDIGASGNTAEGAILSEDEAKKVVQYPSKWVRVNT
jgi:hypothetical protein